MRFEQLSSPTLTHEYVNWATRFGQGRDDNDMRFGQYICNVYLRDGKSFIELFNEENARKAFVMAMGEFQFGEEKTKI